VKHKTTIIYYTDNCLSGLYLRVCQRALEDAANGKRIISVSQRPINFGDNICVGDIGRTHLSLYRQMLIGAEAADTEFVALAEHDCMYTPEHFDWIPPRPNVFYYNVNHYFVQGRGPLFGEYSYARRRPLSMLIAGREVFIKAITEKVWMLEHGWMIRKGMGGACEPGTIPPEKAMVPVPVDHMMRPEPPDFVNDYEPDDRVRSLRVEPGVLDHKRLYLAALNDFKDLGKEVGRWTAKGFATELPNLDIRTGMNFTGVKRPEERRSYELPYWGRFAEVMKKYA
jgi:hypothetical protein